MEDGDLRESVIIVLDVNGKNVPFSVVWAVHLFLVFVLNQFWFLAYRPLGVLRSISRAVFAAVIFSSSFLCRLKSRILICFSQWFTDSLRAHCFLHIWERCVRCCSSPGFDP
jgi:hypothetical protein